MHIKKYLLLLITIFFSQHTFSMDIGDGSSSSSSAAAPSRKRKGDQENNADVTQSRNHRGNQDEDSKELQVRPKETLKRAREEEYENLLLELNCTKFSVFEPKQTQLFARMEQLVDAGVCPNYATTQNLECSATHPFYTSHTPSRGRGTPHEPLFPGSNGLMACTQHKQLSTFKFLLTKGANPNGSISSNPVQPGFNKPLILAMIGDFLEPRFVHELLKAKADIVAGSYPGITLIQATIPAEHKRHDGIPAKLLTYILMAETRKMSDEEKDEQQKLHDELQTQLKRTRESIAGMNVAARISPWSHSCPDRDLLIRLAEETENKLAHEPQPFKVHLAFQEAQNKCSHIKHPLIKTIFANPKKIFAHIVDDSGEIISDPQSSSASSSSSSSSPSSESTPKPVSEGQLFRSILFPRNDIHGNIADHLRCREMGLPTNHYKAMKHTMLQKRKLRKSTDKKESC